MTGATPKKLISKVRPMKTRFNNSKVSKIRGHGPSNGVYHRKQSNSKSIKILSNEYKFKEIYFFIQYQYTK